MRAIPAEAVSPKREGKQERELAGYDSRWMMVSSATTTDNDTGRLLVMLVSEVLR